MKNTGRDDSKRKRIEMIQKAAVGTPLSPRSKQLIREGLGETENDFHLEEGEDPINRLGFGFISFFDMI